MSAPDLAVPIVGWRTWRVVGGPHGLRLSSVMYPNVWEPRQELQCTCLRAPRRIWQLRRRPRATHDAPHAQCTCGIYAAKDVAFAGRYAFASDFESRGTITRVVGLVALWGRVLACKRGWRAQYAYPSRIYVPYRGREKESRLVELAFTLAEYGVPVELMPHCGERDLVRSLARTELETLGRV